MKIITKYKWYLIALIIILMGSMYVVHINNQIVERKQELASIKVPKEIKYKPVMSSEDSKKYIDEGKQVFNEFLAGGTPTKNAEDYETLSNSFFLTGVQPITASSNKETKINYLKDFTYKVDESGVNATNIHKSTIDVYFKISVFLNGKKVDNSKNLFILTFNDRNELLNINSNETGN